MCIHVYNSTYAHVIHIFAHTDYTSIHCATRCITYYLLHSATHNLAIKLKIQNNNKIMVNRAVSC